MEVAGGYLLVCLFIVFCIGAYGIMKVEDYIHDSAAAVVWDFAAMGLWFFTCIYLAAHIIQFFLVENGWCWDINARW